MSITKDVKTHKDSSHSRRVKSARDARKVSGDAMFEIRVRAVRAVTAGYTQRDVARKFGVCEECISRWMERLRSGGEEALRFKLQRSGSAGKARLLTDEQEEQLCQIIHTTTPSHHGIQVSLWTRKVIAQFVVDLFNIAISERTAGRIMKRHGMSAQRPKRKAYQQDAEDLSNWCKNEFPEIEIRAKKTGSTIVWIDETTLKSGPNYGRTWSKIGETPVVPTEGRSQTLNVIGALSINGEFVGMSYETSTNSDVVVSFLEYLNRVFAGKVIVIMDNAGYHKSKAVQEFSKKWRGIMELIYQPPYCPETNPVEIVWSYLKSKRLCSKMTKGKEEFLSCASKIIAEISVNKSLCLQFFKHKELGYIGKQSTTGGCCLTS